MTKKTYIQPEVQTIQLGEPIVMQNTSIGVSHEDAYEDACAPSCGWVADDTDDSEK